MRIESLTLFRFVAAIIVVVSHFGAETGLASIAPGLMASGPQMVSFFFVLSGVVLALAYVDRPEQPGFVVRFWWARVARIVPVYLLALALSIVLFWNAPSTTANAVLLDVLFLQAWFPPYPLAINGPAWSLSVEAFFYATFPLSLWYLRQARPTPRGLIIASLACWAFSQAVLTNLLHPRFYAGFPSISFDLIHYLPLSHLASFWLGIAGGYWLLRNRDRFRLSPAVSVVLVSVSAGALVAALEYKHLYASVDGFRAALHGGFFAPLFLFFMLMLSLADTRTTAWLASPALVLLGEASYSLYILQQPIHALYVEQIASRWALARQVGFYGYASVLVLLSLIILLAYERPAQRWLRRLPPGT